MAKEQEIVSIEMAEKPKLIPLASNVTAHCAGCTCSGVATTSFLTVGTSLPTSAGSKHSEGIWRSCWACSKGAGSGNGHVGDLSKHLGGDDDHRGPHRGKRMAVEATNLQELISGRYERLRIAYQDWEKRHRELKERLVLNEDRQNITRNEIYQLIGIYIVFQGVLFTAVASSSTLHCYNWWMPFSLSLLTSLVTIVVVLQKLWHLLALDTTMAHYKISAKELRLRIKKVLYMVGPRKFDFSKHARDRVYDPSIFMPRLAKLYAVAVLTVLLSFSVIFLLSCWRLLCRPGDVAMP